MRLRPLATSPQPLSYPHRFSAAFSVTVRYANARHAQAKDEELWAARTAASFMEERSRANSRSHHPHEGSRADHPTVTRDQPTSSVDAAAAQGDTSQHHEEPPSPSWSGSDDGALGDRDAEAFGRGDRSSRPSPVFVQRLSARNQALQSPDAKPGAQSTLQVRGWPKHVPSGQHDDYAQYRAAC